VVDWMRRDVDKRIDYGEGYGRAPGFPDMPELVSATTLRFLETFLENRSADRGFRRTGE